MAMAAMGRATASKEAHMERAANAPAYGLWSLVIINSLVFLIVAQASKEIL